ncbi:hypothetical protein [Mycobacterium paraterrae]|uniref:Uncharacterized protein n=1 Tax=Mycobacterium paraterrae TaxID=577492 RepID=A0ABY3VJN2_9MYCO|nr:hypothetical protein [Mycobacterium paraterrae]UMB69598.1 hypothetical protein MKK62_25250 [Mycobacterium paraterrae]
MGILQYAASHEELTCSEAETGTFAASVAIDLAPANISAVILKPLLLVNWVQKATNLSLS